MWVCGPTRKSAFVWICFQDLFTMKINPLERILTAARAARLEKSLLLHSYLHPLFTITVTWLQQQLFAKKSITNAKSNWVKWKNYKKKSTGEEWVTGVCKTEKRASKGAVNIYCYILHLPHKGRISPCTKTPQHEEYRYGKVRSKHHFFINST